MQKQYYFIKLNASRPTFAQDMTDEEKVIMQAHIAYWKPYLDDGTMLVFGPVMDPAGVYGVGILAVENELQMRDLVNKDPASGIGRYDAFPMRAVIKS